MFQEKGVWDMPNSFEKLYHIVDGLNARFVNGNEPFQMVARLCEEAGELAKEVNHFEGMGIKVQKHGEPDKVVLVKEVQDVIRVALSIARYYGIEGELERSIDGSYEKLRNEEHIK